MTPYQGYGQPYSQREGVAHSAPDQWLAQTEAAFAWEEETACVEAEASAETLDEAQQHLLLQIDAEQEADFWQQMAEEDADFGLYPFSDPGLYW